MQHKALQSICVAAVLTMTASAALPQTTSAGGRGLFRVFSAETVQQGSTLLNTSFLSFVRSSGDVHTWNIGITYGLSNSVELTAQIVPYQDDQAHKWGPPGNTQLGVKWRLPLPIRGISAGVRAGLTLPTAKNANVPFQPFSANTLAMSVNGLLTLDLTRSNPIVPLKVHANIGYREHNVLKLFTRKNTEQLLLGIGFKVPAGAFILYSEYTAEVFLKGPASFFENSMRVTQGLKFVGLFNIILDLGVDVGVSRKPEASSAILHEYAAWKVFGGLTYQFNTARILGLREKRPKTERKKVERTLQQIKDRRQKVDEDLEKMSKELKENKKKKDDSI